MDNKRSLSDEHDETSNPDFLTCMEGDESMQEEGWFCDTPARNPFINDSGFGSHSSNSSRKKAKMDVDIYPRFRSVGGDNRSFLTNPPSQSSSDASNSSTSSSGSSSSSSSNQSSSNTEDEEFLCRETTTPDASTSSSSSVVKQFNNNMILSSAQSSSGSDAAALQGESLMAASCESDHLRPGVLREIREDQAASGAGDSSYYLRCRFRNFITPLEVLHPPLPNPMKSLSDSEDIWKDMLKKEAIYKRSSNYMSHHRDIRYRMRAILIDWIMEVCEEYKLKRTTLYLACEFFDRYMSNTQDIPKTRLQLVGVTSLFIASKIEEIHPPRLQVFAELTDGACCEKDIIHQELMMYHKLEWMMSPATSIMWLQLYLQIFRLMTTNEPKVTLNSRFSLKVSKEPKKQLVTIALLLDMCLLDLEHLDFPPSVLAATALYYHYPDEVSRVTGYTQSDLHRCIKWMLPFVYNQRKRSFDKEKVLADAWGENERYAVQTHTASMENLDMVLENRERLERANRSRDPAPSNP